MKIETNWKDATPVEVDTVLSKLWNAKSMKRQERQGLENQVKRHLQAVGKVDYLDHRGRPTEMLDYLRRSWTMTAQQMIENCDQIPAIDVAIQWILNAIQPLEAEFDSRPWSRYFLVQNLGGHVHRERHCGTCYSTTSYGWLIELSGCDESQMIVDYGESACTVCFPDAPTNPAFSGPGRIAKADQEAKRAEKLAGFNAKAAAKALKGIRSPDGGALRTTGGWGIRITTEREARIGLTDSIESILYEAARKQRGEAARNSDALARYVGNVALLSEAIAAKTGVMVETVIVDHEKKALKKFFAGQGRIDPQHREAASARWRALMDATAPAVVQDRRS